MDLSSEGDERMNKLEVFENGGYRYTTERSMVSNVSQEDEPIAVYEGIEAEKQMWMIQFNSLKDTEQAIVKAVCPEVFTMLDEGKSVKHPERVYKIAMSRLSKSPFTKTCSRCGGTGNHSFNLKDGTICYGCSGYRKVLPKITQKLLKEIAEHYKQTP
jgi:hypothetical protein